MSDPFNICNRLGINYETLKVARQVVARIWEAHPKYPSHMKTDYERDRIIAGLGPAAIERIIKTATDNGVRKAKTFVFLDKHGNPMS